MLTGEYQPEPPLSSGKRLLKVLFLVRLGLFLLPWALMSGGLILVGALALGPRKKDSPELWICLPAGLALLAVFFGFPLWLWRRLPRWVQRFEYDGGVLSYAFHAGRPLVSRPVENITEVATYYLRRQGLAGYRITFRDRSSILLSERVTHADELYAALKQAVGP
jgi:hypothetical protein